MSPKWKRVDDRKGRVWRRLNKQPELPAGLMITLLAMSLIILSVGGMYVYWATNVKPSYVPGGTQDPFTTLWNGQILNTTSTTLNTGSQFFATCNIGSFSAGTGSCSATLSIPSGGAVLMVAQEVRTAGSAFCNTNGGGVSDSSSNTYSIIQSGHAGGYATCVWDNFFTGASSSLTITVTGACTSCATGSADHMGASFSIYLGVKSIGNSALSGPTGLTSPITQTINVTSGSAIYSEVGPFASCDSTGTTYNPAQAVRTQFCFNTFEMQSADIIQAQHAGLQSYTYTNTNGLSDVVTVEMKPAPIVTQFSSFTNSCPGVGYTCWNSFVTQGNIQLQPPTGQGQPSIAVSNSTVQLSNCSAKACAFSGAICIFSGCPSLQLWNGEEIAWYWSLSGAVNTNQPGSPNWNPVNDPSGNVALAFLAYYNTTGPNWDYAVYIQRHLGTPLNSGSQDVYPNINGLCPTNNNVFICYRGTSFPGIMSLILNFTGGANGGGGSTLGLSYACVTNGGSAACGLGGNNNQQINTVANVITSYTLPWLNIQNEYHVGFWMSPEPLGITQATIEASTSNKAITWTILSVYTPASVGTQDTGSFTGFFGRTLGGVWNTVTGAVGSALNFLSPVFDIGNSIMSAFIGALIQAFSYLVEGFRILLNALGNFFGVGNVGDFLILLFANIDLFLVQVVSSAIGWFVNYVQLMFQFVQVITNFIANGIFITLATYIAGPILTFLNIMWTVITIFLSYGFAASYLLMVDWLFGMVEVWFAGITGLLRWINLNIVIFTKFFKGTYWLATESKNVILTIAGMIRGAGTGTGTAT